MGPFSVPSQATVFANGMKQVSGKISFSAKGEAKTFKTFDGPLIASTIGDYEFTLESPVFKADGLSVADATARALSAEVAFSVTLKEDGHTFGFFGKRSGRDIAIDPENPATNSRTYITSEPSEI